MHDLSPCCRGASKRHTKAHFCRFSHPVAALFRKSSKQSQAAVERFILLNHRVIYKQNGAEILLRLSYWLFFATTFAGQTIWPHQSAAPKKTPSFHNRRRAIFPVVPLLFVCALRRKPLRVSNPIRCNRRNLSQPCLCLRWYTCLPFNTGVRCAARKPCSTFFASFLSAVTVSSFVGYPECSL